MTAPLLTRHPPHGKTESLFPYVLRLSEKNGYETPSGLLLFVGQYPAALSPGIDLLKKLDRATNHVNKDLKSIGYTLKGRTRLLLGHNVDVRHLRLNNPRICPECILELGIIEAHFDLSVMIACPMHRTFLLSACPICQRSLRWYRPGLLECECGAKFDSAKLSIAPTELIDLLDVVRRRVLRLRVPERYPSGIPASELGRLGLHSLLFLIDVIGRRQSQNFLYASDFDRIVPFAAHALAQWPHNFHEMLEQLRPNDQSVAISTGIFHGLYSALSYGIKQGKHTEFLMEALSQFAINNRGEGRHSSNRGKNEQLPRYISNVEFARRSGIDPESAAKWLAKVNASVLRESQGGRNRVWVDLSSIQDISRTLVLSDAKKNKVSSITSAAKLLGMPRSLFKLLLVTQDFEIKNSPRSRYGVPELDIKAFAEKLMARIPSRRSLRHAETTIRLGEIVRYTHSTLEMKAEMIRRVLRGELNVLGWDGGGIDSLLISKGRFLEFLRLDTTTLARTALGSKNYPFTTAQAGRELCCSYKSIPILVQKRYLKGVWLLRALWVSRESLEEFKRNYVPVRTIASRIRTSSAALMRFCRSRGIAMIVCVLTGKDGKQAFVRASDQNALMSSRAEWESKRTRARRLHRAA